MIFDKEQNPLVFVSTTCTDRAEARSIAFSCLNEKLAVCCDYWPVESIYPWQGQIEDIEQYMLVLTTEKTKSDDLVKFILGLHSYSVPMVAVTETKIKNPAYSLWAKNTLADTGAYTDKSDSNTNETIFNKKKDFG